MARTTITPQTAAAAYGAAAEMTMTPGDAVNDNRYIPGNNDVLIVQNADLAESGNVVLKGAECPHGRSTDTTITCTAGQIKQVRVPKNGYKQTDGYVYLNPSALTETYSSHDADTEIITVGASTKFTAGQLVTLEGGTFGGLTLGASYYVLDPTGATFKLEATLGGGAINLTSAVASGSPVFTPAASHMKIAVLRY